MIVNDKIILKRYKYTYRQSLYLDAQWILNFSRDNDNGNEI